MNPRISESVKHLLIINVLIYLICRFNPMNAMDYLQYLALHDPLQKGFFPTQFVTYMFMHGSDWHLLFNMISLYFIGPTAEFFLGKKRFLILYFVSGVIGAFSQIIFSYGITYIEYGQFLTGSLVGASAAISGLFGALVCFVPDNKVVIFPIFVPIKLKWAFIGFAVFSLIAPFINAMPGLGHYAHLGGLLSGFLITRNWKKKLHREW